MQVEFSEIARKTLDENIQFLRKIWTSREIVNFLQDVKRITNDLENGHYSQFQNSADDSIKSVLIGKKHVRMFFRKENEQQIKVLLFFDMRQNPEKIIELLK